ncbi:MAG TPA: PfkB family carbohydrate kinase [Chloroflexota bacterium]
MIAVVGDLMVDVFLLDTLRLSEQRHGIELKPGGSAANTAVWLANQDCEVSFSGCVGADWVGSALRTALESAGVRQLVRSVSAQSTGSVLVEISPEGEHTMRSSRGANASLSPRDIERLSAEDLHVLHLTGYSLLGDAGIKLLHTAAAVACSAQARLTFDPSSVGVIEALGRENLLDALRSASVDLLLPNASEACALGDCATPEEAARRLGTVIPRLAVKLGARGCLAVEGPLITYLPTVPVEALDTTGAGDGFNAGVLAALVAGGDLIIACQAGNSLATHVLRRYGAWPESPA